ncbi:HlyD family efflux transporter periplasmic adaptor subunit [Corynebacterium sp. Q4381]|uniref:efflux RND transporter periplasmic adaptor subunit n=1 Tax=Corynebacterium sp. Marseille-Q4381 TaxID=3121597 RepID=UPI002FE62A12
MVKRRDPKRTAAAVIVAASLFAASCSAGGLGGGDNADGDGLAPGDYTIVNADGVSSSVVVNGKIAPVRAVSITTPLQSEVRTVAVAPGDRVQVEQLLAAMDTDQLERQLAVQEQQQANAQAEAMAGVEQAQAQLNSLNEMVNNGTHPTIRSAQSQVNQAQAAYNAAVAANGGARAVRVANEMAGQISSKVHSVVGGYNEPQLPANPFQPANPAQPADPAAPAPANPAPNPAQPANPAAPGVSEADIAQLTGAGAGAGVSVDEAYAALQDAKANLAAAQAQVAQERSQLQAQVDSAWRSAEAAKLDSSDGTLEYQVQEATIYSPINGIVTSVDVQEGDIPQGRVLSLADDSSLLIRADVREADVPSIAKGNKVTFTSTATGKKEYTGRVVRISPAAAQPTDPQAALQGGGDASSVVFPVEIEVTGDTEGLLLGGSVRAEIITQQEDDALNVPLDAVYDNEGAKKVLVLATDGDGARSGRIEERTVETGASNDVDIAITGGDLQAGDIVVNWPEEYTDRIGETVKITDSGFDPEDVVAAREGGEKEEKGRTTATVTVTSTRTHAPEEAPEEAPAS